MSDHQLDFSLLLASSVHDMKNSLGMLLTSLADLVADYPPQNDDQRKRYGILEGEASRIKNDLTYLLGLYRLQNEGLPVDIDEVIVYDFLQFQCIQNEVLFEMRDLQVSIECEENLKGYFDEDLVGGVINNILVNAAKYASKTITIKSVIDQEFLKIQVIDDGCGYPQEMIKEPQAYTKGIDFQTGSTNLGLHFAAKITDLHQRGESKGYIQLENTAEGGGCFTLCLP